MKKILLFVFFPAFGFAQKIPTGIYQLDYNTDPNFVHQFVSKFNDQDRNGEIKFVYNLKYEPLIDTSHKIKYAVIINKQDISNKENYQLKMLWLNKDQPSNYNVSYSDDIVRKFIKLDISVDKKNLNWLASSHDYDEPKGFLNYYFEEPKENDYETKFNDSPNFGINKNQFLLKSNHYKLKIDSIKVDSSSYYNNPLVGEGFRRGVKYETISQQVIAFTLRETKNYIDFLPIQQDSIKFYTSINKESFISLNPGDFVALKKETGEWYDADYISLDGQAISGVIFIDDLSIGNIITKQINGLTLKIKYQLYDDDQRSWNHEGEVSRIKIYQNNKLIQVIKKPGLINDTSEIISFQDVNFDGYKDLVVFADDGGAGPNFSNNYYIFNPKNKQFVFNEKMSDLSQPNLDTKSKTVNASWRDGAATYGKEKYKWINNKLTQIEFSETEYLDENRVRITRGYLSNGKMKTSTKIVKADKFNK